MIVAAGLLVVGIGSLALIARALLKAPEGYEDEYGFHIVRKKAVSRVFSGSMTTKIRASRGSRRGQSQDQRGDGQQEEHNRQTERVIASAQMRDDRADKEQDKADRSGYPDQWHADADQ
jgi:hypothetical protein